MNNQHHPTTEDALRKQYHDALSSRNISLARKLATTLGEELPLEYSSLEQEELPPYEKIRITNKTDIDFVDQQIAEHAAQEKYSVLLFNDPITFKEYNYQKVAPEYEDVNFNSAQDAGGVKDIYDSPLYYFKTILNKNLSVVLQETDKNMQYHVLRNITDKEGYLREELVNVLTKTASKEDCIELLVEEHNFERPGLLLPTKEYDWKQQIIRAYHNEGDWRP